MRQALLPSAVFVLLFLGLMFLLLLHRTIVPDQEVSTFFSGLPPGLYFFFAILCRSGNVEIELPLLLAAGSFLWLRHKEERSHLVIFLALLVLGTLLEHFLKMDLPRYSPSKIFQHDPLSGWEIFFPAHFHVISSFPSGHAFRALLILVFVDRYFPHLRLPVLFWALFIMAGVVALGWHWSSDVVGSALLVLAIRPWIDAWEKR